MPTTVLATRFNNLQRRIQKVLGSSSSTTPTFGYGQTFNSSTVVGDYDTNLSNTDLISARDYENLYRDIVRARVHQVGSTAFSAQDTPVGDFSSGNADKIQETYITYLENLATQIETDKFNIGSDQFSVEPLADSLGNEINVSRQEVVSGSWNGTLAHIFKVTFLSSAARRHFFNAGGKIRLSTSIDWAFSQAKTNDWKTMLSNMGIVNFSATGTSSANAVGSATSIGNYSLSGSYQLVYRQTGSAYSGSSYEVYALELSSTEIQFRIYYNDTTSEIVDENVFGDLTSNISIVKPEGSVVYKGTEITTADISTPPVGQNIAVFNGVVLQNPPTVTANWSPSTGTVGSIHRLIWSATNTTSVSYSVIGPDGQTYSGTGNPSGNATFNWNVAGTVSAVVTATGPGGIVQDSASATVQNAVVVPTYAISAALPSTLNEGQIGINYGVATTNVAIGTLLYWDTEVVTGNIIAADFQGGTLSGSVSISQTGGGGAYIYRAASADTTTEGTETFRLRLFTDVSRTNLVATSDLISINDISTNLPTYSLTANSTGHPVNPSYIDENGTYTASFTVNTTDVSNGTILYWTTTGTNITNNDFTDNATTGTVTINNNTAQISRTARADQTTEGTELFSIQLRTSSYSGTIVASSSNRTILDTSKTPPNPQPNIDSFTSDKSSITAGDDFTVSWASSQATYVTLTQTNPNGTTTSVQESTSGSRTLTPPSSPTGTASVTVQAFNDTVVPTVSSSISTLNVIVNAAPVGPSITSFEFSPVSIVEGGNSVLYWATSNATSVQYRIPGVVDSFTTIGASGNTTIAFPTTSNYTAELSAFSSVTGTTVTASANISVTATPASPTIDTFGFSPSTIESSESSTLYWTTSNATSVQYRIPGVVGSFTTVGTSGTTPISFPVIGDYTAELSAFSSATGTTVTDTASITVESPPAATPTIDSLVWSPSSASSGNTTVSWTTTNAGRVQTVIGGVTNSNNSLDGSETFPATTNYTATISVYDTNGSFGTSQSADFTYVPAEADNAFSVNPTTVNRYELIGATISGEPGRTYTIGGDFSDSGTIPAGGSIQRFFFKADGGTYTMSCSFSSGNSVSSVSITVLGAVPSPTISITPSTVDQGTPLTVSWSSGTGTASQISWSNPNGTQLGSSTALSGSASIATSLIGTYSATINSQNNNGGGSAGASATVQQPVAAPTIDTFGFSPGTIEQGETSTLYWTTSNATSVIVDGVAVGASGTQVKTYTQAGTFTHSISATGPGGTASDSTTVTVNAPPAAAPTIDTFGFSPSTINTGDSATLEWATSNATSVTVDGVSVGTSGTQVKTYTQAGTFSHSISATGPGGTASDSTSVTVSQPVAAPSVSVYFTPSSGDTNTQFSAGWTVTGNYTSITATQVSNGVQSSLGSSPTGSFSQTLPAGNHSLTVSATGPGGTSSDSGSASVTAVQQVINATAIAGGGSAFVSANTSDSGSFFFAVAPSGAAGSWSASSSGPGPVTITNTVANGTSLRVDWATEAAGGSPDANITASWTNDGNGVTLSAVGNISWGN